MQLSFLLVLFLNIVYFLNLSVFYGSCLSLKLYFIDNIYYIFHFFIIEWGSNIFLLLFEKFPCVLCVNKLLESRLLSLRNRFSLQTCMSTREMKGFIWIQGTVMEPMGRKYYWAHVGLENLKTLLLSLSSLLFFCVCLTLFLCPNGHFSVLFPAFCTRWQSHSSWVYLSPLQKTSETELSFLNSNSELPVERSTGWWVMTG